MALFGSDSDITVKIKADSSDAEKKLNTLGISVGKLAAGFTLGNLAAQAINKGMTVLTGVVSDSVKAWNESEHAVAQLNAVLESTQHAAGLSAQELIDLSKQLQETTTYSDEAVLSVENLLLTFTNITGDTFAKATATVLDMATALGTDASGAAIQLGKALNDPILGITALTRVGVNFDNQQKEMIETLVKTGHTLQAQDLILEELNREFGGSATAAAKTFEGQMKQVANKVNDVQEGIGHGLVAALDAAFISFNKTTGAMNSTVDIGKGVFSVFGFITEAAANTAAGIHTIAAAIVDLGSYVVQSTGYLQLFGVASNESFEFFRESVNEGARATQDFAVTLHNENEKMLADWDKITGDSRKFATTGPAAYRATAEEAKKAQEHIQKVADANRAVLDSISKIADLIDGRLSGIQNNRRAQAEAFVQEENDLRQLKSEADDTTDRKEEQRILREIDVRQAALDEKKDMEVTFAEEIAEARRRASETEFERHMEDLQRQDAEDAKAYAKKYSALQRELSDNLIKVQALTAGEVQITATVQVESEKRTAIIVKETDKQVAAYMRVANAASRSYGKSIDFSRLSLNSGASLPHFALGGTVPGPVGTAVPIIAHGQETIIPAGRKQGGEGGNTYSVVINNPVIRGHEDADYLRRQIEDALRDVTRGHKLATI